MDGPCIFSFIFIAYTSFILFVSLYCSPSLTHSLPVFLSLLPSLSLSHHPSHLPFPPVSQVGDIATTTSNVQQLEHELTTLRAATSSLQTDLNRRITDLEYSLQVAREDQDRAKAFSDADCRYATHTEQHTAAQSRVYLDHSHRAILTEPRYLIYSALLHSALLSCFPLAPSDVLYPLPPFLSLLSSPFSPSFSLLPFLTSPSFPLSSSFPLLSLLSSPHSAGV